MVALRFLGRTLAKSVVFLVLINGTGFALKAALGRVRLPLFQKSPSRP